MNTSRAGGRKKIHFFKRDVSKAIDVNATDNLIGTVELIDIREPYLWR